MTIIEVQNYFRHVLPSKDDQIFLSQLLDLFS